MKNMLNCRSLIKVAIMIVVIALIGSQMIRKTFTSILFGTAVLFFGVCPVLADTIYDFTQTFEIIEVSGTLTFSGSVPASLTVDDLNANAVWNLAFSTSILDPAFPVEPFTLTESNSTWVSELFAGTALQINAGDDALVFDLITPPSTNAAVVLMSNANFNQFRFVQVNQPGFQGTQVLIQDADSPGRGFFMLPLDENLRFPIVSQPIPPNLSP